MRIAYLAASKIPSRAANTVQTMKMCGAFAENGHDVTLFCRASIEAPDADPRAFYGVEQPFRVVPLDPMGPSGLRTPSRMLRLGAQVRRLAPDLLFARDLQALVATSFLRIPMVLEVHREIHDGVESALFDWLLDRSAFERLVVVSGAMRDRFVASFPKLVRHEIVLAPGAAEPPVRVAPHQPWPGRPGALQLGYAGHLYDGRGVDVLIAMAKLLPDVDLHFVGGRDEDVRRWQEVARGLTNVWFHGFVPHARLAAFYEHFEILLAPYQREVYASGGTETSAVMSPLKLFEYMSRGVPLISSDLPVLHEVITSGQNGLLVEPADPAAWARAVRSIVDDPALRRTLGERAFEAFEKKHTWSSRARRVIEGLPRAVT
ncbi:MAG: glycosyltransferase family 4 protein [Alphaproteobacteria bacterium]|nr:glycosyltransferase family 4 protein [Alphaproteobacteria bacterium]